MDNIDRIAPECEVIYEPNIATSWEVIVTITCNEDVIVGWIENLTWSEISTWIWTWKEIKITENWTWIIIVEDEAWNEKE